MHVLLAAHSKCRAEGTVILGRSNSPGKTCRLEEMPAESPIDVPGADPPL